MKSLKLILLLTLSPLTFFAQQLSGLWIGALSNDSTSIRKDQSFEIVLSQYKEKVYGYSRSTFLVNDTLYYIVKRVKGTISGDICEVKDDYVISHNFPKKPEKGVKVISLFHRNKQDSTWYLEGDWKTKQTKKYYALTGKVDLKEEKDLAASKLLPHLEELSLDKDIPFLVEAKKAEASSIVAKTSSPTSVPVVHKEIPVSKPVTLATASPKAITPARTTEIKSTTTEVAIANPPVNSKETNTGSNNKPETGITKNTGSDLPKGEPVLKTEEVAQKIIPAVVKPTETASTRIKEKAVTNPETIVPAKQTPVVAKNTVPETKKPAEESYSGMEDLGSTIKLQSNTKPAVTKNNEVTTPAKTEQPSATKRIDPIAINGGPEKNVTAQSLIKPSAAPDVAAYVGIRKTTVPQYVDYVSDSLVLILYDNGEVDGDTVSVLLNGEILMAKQGLKTSAIRKTIYITPGNEELTLLLYAENLGKYPPNTGLLVVYDGEDRYQLRFTADLQTNASVVFRRKK